MFIIKLIILVGLGLFVRRIYLSVKKQVQGSRPSPRGGDGGRARGAVPSRKKQSKNYREEDISDADFEEIP